MQNMEFDLKLIWVQKDKLDLDFIQFSLYLKCHVVTNMGTDYRCIISLDIF